MGDLSDFYQATYPSVVASLWMIGRDRSLAEEAAQEAYVKLVPRWDSVAAFDRPDLWVRRVAINALRDSHRRSRRRNEVPLDAESDSFPPSASQEATIVENLDLASGLSALKRADREVIILFHIDDLTVQEVAEVLGVSGTAVTTRLSRARLRLAQSLDPDSAPAPHDLELERKSRHG